MQMPAVAEADHALLEYVSSILSAPALLFQAFFTIAIINSTLVLIGENLICCMPSYVAKILQLQQYANIADVEMLALAHDHKHNHNCGFIPWLMSANFLAASSFSSGVPCALS